MEWNWKESNQQKHQYKSYYCAGCLQSKPCQLLTGWDSEYKSYCCQCYFQREQEKTKEYSNYQQVYQQKVKEKKLRVRQLGLLKNYQGCHDCKSLAVDAYELYEKNKLVCQPCLISKKGSSSSPISFLEQSKWYRKRWGVDLREWLTNFQGLPVNKNCANEWLRNREHLRVCQCLEKEVQELVELFSGSLEEYQEKLKDCKCVKSEKFRVDSDYSTACEKCGGEVSVASKKRVIKDRNDPRFWGLECEERVLRGGCLENQKEKMPPLRKAEFNRYRKTGRL